MLILFLQEAQRILSCADNMLSGFGTMHFEMRGHELDCL
jgi:hypothetical protein